MPSADKDADRIERDLDTIRALAGVLEETGLTEVEIERGSLRLRVSRSAGVAVANAPVATPSPVPVAASAPGASAPAADAPGSVRSPMVGTAYLAPSPGAAPFVAEGAQVSQGQTVMIIEAMKTMNEIKAPKAGTVRAIHARDAEPVEYDEVLMVIE